MPLNKTGRLPAREPASLCVISEVPCNAADYTLRVHQKYSTAIHAMEAALKA